MDAIETKTIERAGRTYRIRIYPDTDVSNPLDDRGEMGSILSLNRRHSNCLRGSVDHFLEENPEEGDEEQE